jgi:hypothetical protein
MASVEIGYNKLNTYPNHLKNNNLLLDNLGNITKIIKKQGLCQI